MIALRSAATSSRHRSAVTALLIIVGLLVVWEHAGEPEPHMEDIGGICLAVVSGLSIVGVLSAPALRGRRRPRRPLLAAVPAPPVLFGPAPVPAARAGPVRLQVIRR